MKQKSVTIDLSRKTPEEIAEFMQALLTARRVLSKKGHTVKITRRKATLAMNLPS